MANKYRYRRGPQVDRWIKKTGTVAVAQGDLVMITSSGKITPVTASGDADDLVGVAMDASPTTDSSAKDIRVLEIGHGTVFEFTVASSTYYYGDPFVLTSAAQTLLKKTVTDLQSTATNVVAICAEDKASTTSVLVQFLPGIFQKDIALS